MVDGRPPLRRLLSPEDPEDRLEYWKAFVGGITPDRVRGGLLDLLQKGTFTASSCGETEQPLAFGDLEALLCGSMSRM